MSQHSVQLLFRDSQPFSVCTVYHQDNELQKRQACTQTHTKKKSLTGHVTAPAFKKGI